MVQKYYPFLFSNEECGFSDQEKLVAMRNGKPVPKDGSPARIQRRTRLSRIVSISDGHPLRGFPDRGFQNGDGNRENQLRPRPSLHVQKSKLVIVC